MAAQERQHLPVLGVEELQAPPANALKRLRRAMSRFIHHRRELGFLFWASTLTAS